MNIQTLDAASDFIDSLSIEDRTKIKASLQSVILNQTAGLIIKTLKGKIKELIVNQYRIVFFIWGNTCYVVDMFKKQSAKTPKRIIDRAEKIYQCVLKIN